MISSDPDFKEDQPNFPSAELRGQMGANAKVFEDKENNTITKNVSHNSLGSISPGRAPTNSSALAFKLDQPTFPVSEQIGQTDATAKVFKDKENNTLTKNVSHDSLGNISLGRTPKISSDLASKVDKPTVSVMKKIGQIGYTAKVF